MTDLRELWESRCYPAHKRWTWDVLRTLYNDPVRHYHTLGHVSQVVGILEEMLYEVTFDREVTLLAAFWHDAVYVPGSQHNEHMSAQILLGLRQALKASEDTVDLAGMCIRRTRTHDPTSIPDVTAFLDADMSILGSHPSDYGLYVEQIRSEYAEYGNAEWALGRSAFLKGQLKRSGIFGLQWSRRAELEAKARSNMASELAAL